MEDIKTSLPGWPKELQAMPTVLVAEADRNLRESYVAFLSGLGFEIHTAVDGLNAFPSYAGSCPTF